MYPTGLIQRDRLFQLATRWFADRPEPEDGRFVTQVFLFESLICSPTLRRFVTDILQETRSGAVRMQQLHSKDDLRALLCRQYSELNDRARELFQQYRQHPDDFFPGTPATMLLIMRECGWPVAMIRIKRIRRIAEKASRRVADCLSDRIQEEARRIARERASFHGVSLQQLISSPGDMFNDFTQAEKAVALAFREEAPAFAPADLHIDDVIGIKFIGLSEELERIEKAIYGHPSVIGVEREEHHGRYNDINLLVDLQLPPADTIVEACLHHDWSGAAQRGLDPQTLPQDLTEYVHGGASHIRTEVILTTCDELLESEFGRSIHEQRILEQRHSVAYSGRIARNASFIIEYMLQLALSPKIESRSLPIKMWGQYLPDYFSQIIWSLFSLQPMNDLSRSLHDISDPMRL